MSVFKKCDEYQAAHALRAENLYTYYRRISSAQDPVVTMDEKKVVMLGSNNYLGLANHPEVKEASAFAAAKYGTGCAGSRLLNGTLDIHVELEEALATFMQRELKNRGFNTGDSASPVVPIVIGEDLTTSIMVKRLQEEGVFANAVISPAVPRECSMIRTSYMATHEREHLDRALDLDPGRQGGGSSLAVGC